MFGRPGRICVCAAVATLLSTAAFAQDTPARTGFGAGVSGGFVDFGGDAFARIGSAFGLEATGRYTWPGNFQLVLGVHYSSHNVEGAATDLRVFSVFVDPRYVLAMMDSERFSPYVGGRVAYVRLGSDDAWGTDGSANGFSIGGLAGFLFEVVPGVAIEGYGYFGGLLLDDSMGNGNMTILQVGVVYTFGG
ncbi:MAG: outer membrane beta-barrel protein [Gemmatimonadales bacterium]